MTERAILTLRQLRSELADLATGLESKRLQATALAVEDVLRDLDSPDDEHNIQIRTPVVVWPDGRWDVIPTSETTTERAAKDRAYMTIRNNHAVGAVVHWIVADLPKPTTTTVRSSVSADG